jgi:hypothetical protein
MYLLTFTRIVSMTSLILGLCLVAKAETSSMEQRLRGQVELMTPPYLKIHSFKPNLVGEPPVKFRFDVEFRVAETLYRLVTNRVEVNTLVLPDQVLAHQPKEWPLLKVVYARNAVVASMPLEVSVTSTTNGLVLGQLPANKLGHLGQPLSDFDVNLLTSDSREGVARQKNWDRDVANFNKLKQQSQGSDGAAGSNAGQTVKDIVIPLIPHVSGLIDRWTKPQKAERPAPSGETLVPPTSNTVPVENRAGDTKAASTNNQSSMALVKSMVSKSGR